MSVFRAFEMKLTGVNPEVVALIAGMPFEDIVATNYCQLEHEHDYSHCIPEWIDLGQE